MYSTLVILKTVETGDSTVILLNKISAATAAAELLADRVRTKGLFDLSLDTEFLKMCAILKINKLFSIKQRLRLEGFQELLRVLRMCILYSYRMTSRRMSSCATTRGHLQSNAKHFQVSPKGSQKICYLTFH